MVTKRASPGKKTVKRKATAAPQLADNAVIVVLESEQSVRAVSKNGIDPDVRRQLVAAEAYFLAERRGFVAGHELEDWVAAEQVVDSRLQHVRAA